MARGSRGSRPARRGGHPTGPAAAPSAVVLADPAHRAAGRAWVAEFGDAVAGVGDQPAPLGRRQSRAAAERGDSQGPSPSRFAARPGSDAGCPAGRVLVREPSGHPGTPCCQKITADLRPPQRARAPISLSAEHFRRVRRGCATASQPDYRTRGCGCLKDGGRARRWRRTSRARIGEWAECGQHVMSGARTAVSEWRAVVNRHPDAALLRGISGRIHCCAFPVPRSLRLRQASDPGSEARSG